MKFGKFKYFIPLSYMFESRFKTLAEKLSWCIIYIIPLSIIFWGGTVDYINFSDCISFVLAITAFLILYEVGYLENDFKTINIEKSPQIRLDNKLDIELISKKYKNLILFRYLIVSVLLVILYINSENYFMNYLFLLILSRVVFKLHNKLRGKINIITYFFLSVIKYLTPLAISINFKQDVYILIFLICMFPTLRTLEHATKPKYEMLFLQKIIWNLDFFRVIYYLFFGVVIFLLIFKNTINTNPKLTFSMSFVCLLYFSYRLFIWLLILFKGKDIYKFRKSKTY